MNLLLIKEKIKFKHDSKIQMYMFYTFIFVVMSIIVFSQFFIYDKTLLTTDDGYLQWYSILVKLKSFLTDLVTGKGTALWSWDTGLGSDFIGNFSFVLFDPFNWLVLLFSKETMDIAYSVICVLKMYAAGFVMLIFLRYHKKPQILCIAGAIGYTFCAWTFFGLRHDFFITQMVLFPLMVLGVDKIEDKKSPITLIISIFLSVCISLYFTWMSAIFIAIYVIVKYFTSNTRKSILSFAIKMGTYMVYAVTGGILLAAPVLFSALYALAHASSGSGVDIEFLPNLKQLFRFIPAFAGNYDIHANYSVVGMNAIFLIMIPAMVFLIRKKKESIVMFGITILFVFFPILQSVTNGFSYASGRWCYVLNFFFAYAAIECMQSGILVSKSYHRAVKIWFVVLFSTSLAALLMVKAITTTNYLFIAINLVLGLVAFLIIRNNKYKAKRKRYYLTGLVCFNATLLLFLSFSPNIGTRLEEYMTVGKCYQIYESSSMKAAKKIKDDDFYRVDTVEKMDSKGQVSTFATTPANTNIYWEIPTVFQYISTIDENWFEFHKRLGNNSSYFRRVCTNSNDNRSRMDFLLGVRYFLGDDNNKGIELTQYAGYGYEPVMSKNNVEILKSRYNTSLGYVFEHTLSETKFLQYQPLEREQILMQGIQMRDEDMNNLKYTTALDSDRIYLDNQTVDCDVKPLLGASVSSNKISVTQENAKIEIIPKERVENSEIYLVFRGLKRKPATPDQLWEMRVNAAKTLWNEERVVRYDTDALAKKRFFDNYFSYKPYGDMTIKVNKNNIEKRLLNVEGEVRAIRNIEDYIVNLGYVNKDTGSITCFLNQIGEYSFDRIEIVAVSQGNFDAQARKLENNRLNISEYGNNRINGTINSKEGGILFLSILYHDGWQIYVDGEKIEQKYLVNAAFTGVEVSPGKHKIELLYRPIGFNFSIILLLSGVVIIVLVEIYRRRQLRKE